MIFLQKYLARLKLIWITFSLLLAPFLSGGPFVSAQESFVPTGAFLGEYYNNIDLTDLALSREDPEINFDWGFGSPDPSMDGNSFSVRWTGNFIFEEGRYRFKGRSDDGIRIYVDNKKIIDKWKNQVPTNVETETDIEKGAHQVRIEYYEDRGGAKVQVSWDRIGPIQVQETITGTVTPTLTPSATPTATAEPTTTPQVLNAGDSNELPKTGLSDYDDVLFISLLSIFSIFGLYLYNRFDLAK